MSLSLSNEKRRTGRTHNMILEALEVGSTRCTSIVVFATRAELDQAVHSVLPNCFPKDFYQYHVASRRGRIEVHVGHKHVATFVVMGAPGILGGPNDPMQWETPGQELFIDHRIIELHYSDILRAWTRYDNPHHRVNFHG